ncbi:Thioesterase/thiol ester dehydrase-isomerase [Xylariomycetidae sp. FL2044]|nr:Thioesterase/thiol ester dehydrase-isomerase [Xylariomycetidae sp. FL2044]
MSTKNNKASSALSQQTEYFISQGVNILKEPTVIPFVPASRQPIHHGGASPDEDALFSRDTLFRETLDSESAIPNYVGFYHDPFGSGPDPTTTFPDLPFIARSISLVLDCRAGTHGFHATVHGGLMCAMMDEAMGTLLFQNRALNREAKARGLIPAASPDLAPAMTARMDVRYRRPIPTPHVVIVTASLARVEGRKLQMHVVVESKNGQEYATCDGMFIRLRERKL